MTINKTVANYSPVISFVLRHLVFQRNSVQRQSARSAKVAGVLFCLNLVIGASSLQAANWYVSSTVATSGNGTSWATAWKNPANITWGSISAGDTIYMDGGTSGLSYGAFGTITTSGTSANYITIARSTESGRDGIVTIPTPLTISGNYIKFDGGSYKQVSGTTYRCGIVFTCSSSAIVGSIPSGSAVSVTGQRPWFRYCYFNGNYGASTGHSFGANNSTGFVLERCWFYQSCYEDQWVYAASASGGSVSITNTVFQDNNKPNRSDTAHRDVANPWTGRWRVESLYHRLHVIQHAGPCERSTPRGRISAPDWLQRQCYAVE